MREAGVSGFGVAHQPPAGYLGPFP